MNQTIYTNQNQKLALTDNKNANSWFLFFLLLSTLSFQLQAQEICDNRIDDDGDGLIDCLDPDCYGTETCWDCITEFYQVHSTQSGTYTNLATITGAEMINGAQFNQIDGHVYAPIMKNGEHKLGMLLQTGEVRETGLDLPGTGIFYVGSIDADGTMYVSNSGGIFSIELNDSSLEVIPTGVNNPGVADFALDLTRGLFYGITGSSKLKVFDPYALEVTTYDLAGSINSDSGAYGAAWSSNDGSFFAYNNSSGKIYSIDVVNLTATQVLNGTGNLSINDGFNCVLADPPFESGCNNGIDDDGDGLIDCEDGDCFASNQCTVEICDNGIDDDGDGWVDCSDTECFNLSFCVEICDNGIDDNGDGLIDSDDPQCTVPSGVSGGLESNGSLADKISRRNIRLAMEGDEDVAMKEEGVIPFRKQVSKTAYEVSDFVPQDFSDAYIAESTPTDLIELTNATEVIAADYYLKNQRVASILAIESDDVYEHTKYICDRLDGSRLLDMSPLYHSGGLFMSYELINDRSKVEYAVSFSMYHDSDVGFVIENHWNLDTYPKDRTYFNFQIWASDYHQLTSLLRSTIEKIKAADNLSEINSSALPSVFVCHGEYHNGELELQIRNKSRSKQLRFESMVRRTETSEWETLDLEIELNGKPWQNVTLPVGHLYDLGASIDAGVNTRDEVFMADGRWTVDETHQGASVIEYQIEPQETIELEGGYIVERAIQVKAEVSDYLNIYRSLDPKYRSVDLSEFESFSLKATGTGLMQVTLVKASVADWNLQPRSQIRLDENSRTYSLSKEDFYMSAEEDWSDVIMIVFSLVNDKTSAQLYEIEISDVLFQNEETSASHNLEEITSTCSVSPNPVSATATISFESEKDARVDLKIYDNLGRLSMIKKLRAISGLNNIEINLSTLNGGSYTYILEMNREVIHGGKLVKL